MKFRLLLTRLCRLYLHFHTVERLILHQLVRFLGFHVVDVLHEGIA